MRFYKQINESVIRVDGELWCYFSHIKYIKNDDDKFLYIVEEISTRNLIKKVYIVGTIVGIGFGLYIFYKNIFK